LLAGDPRLPIARLRVSKEDCMYAWEGQVTFVRGAKASHSGFAFVECWNESFVCRTFGRFVGVPLVVVR
jgi:hypothetical protein